MKNANENASHCRASAGMWTIGRRRRAFTLLEMLMAVAILGVLISIALPSYAAYIQRARNAQAKTDIVNIESQIARIGFTDNGRVPDSLAQLGGAPLDPW